MDTLLLVEDDPNIGRIAAQKLEHGLEVPVAWTKTLEETRTLLATASEKFCAAVLDFVLPDAMDGEVVDLVVQQGIPSIVFTSGLSGDIRESLWSKKVADYVLKDDPSCIDYLISSLNRILSNRSTQILLVDDSPFFQKVLSELLSIHQYQLLVTANAEDALVILARNPGIKLVLTDFNMPGMNGCDLCKTIRKTHKKEDLGIIGISAEGDKTMAARFIKCGANDFIIKQSFIREEFYLRVSQCIENIELIRQTKKAAVSDFLTGLYNRRYFFEQGRQLFQTAEASGSLLACIMMDIDHFKRVNDTHGHDAGDVVLKEIARLLTDFSEPGDLLARLGGEEFCILVPAPEALDAITAKEKAFTQILRERFDTLREQIRDTAIPLNENGAPLSVTMSMGVALSWGGNFSQMLKASDEQLYAAKENGRNRLVFEKG